MNVFRCKPVLFALGAGLLLQVGCATFKQTGEAEPPLSASEQLFKEREQAVSGWGCFLAVVGPFLQLLACLNR